MRASEGVGRLARLELGLQLAIVQMPKGIPVATVGLNRADNAGLLAVAMMALGDRALAARLVEHRKSLTAAAEAADRELQAEL